ncbi:MAG TPA: prohibitin family protein [Vicinamibacterales bacterium]|nr:prohibitin family protein [Vicinamibacterales bacterium]
MRFVFFGVLFVAAIAFWSMLRRQHLGGGAAAAVLGIVGLLGVLTLTSVLTVVSAGNVGVVDVFGSVRPTTLKSGLQFVNPMAQVVEMTVRTQEIKETMDVPSKEGMTVNIEVSVLYHLDPEKAADIYRSVGQNYAEVLLEPQFRSVTRGVTAAYEAKALYTSDRERLAQLITADLKQLVEPRGIFIETTPLRKLTLPTKLQSAIEEKLSADQESQRMQFVLAKETQEAERKRIEARGIADFQQIVTLGISDKLLEWKGIEATQDLAKSPNSKIVIIGNAKNGLPLIMGDVVK